MRRGSSLRKKIRRKQSSTFMAGKTTVHDSPTSIEDVRGSLFPRFEVQSEDLGWTLGSMRRAGKDSEQEVEFAAAGYGFVEAKAKKCDTKRKPAAGGVFRIVPGSRADTGELYLRVAV